MRAVHPLLLFALATTAAPVVVTETVTETVRSVQTSGPMAVAVVHAPAKNKEAEKQQQQQQYKQLQLQLQQQKQQQEQREQEQELKKKKKKVQQQKEKSHQKQKPTTPAPHEEKYFHEPGWDLESGHYDARYFRGKVPYEQHRPALRHLIRSYLTTFRDLGVETWLAHGSLLGWWWNGRIMPWDYDLDVQVSVATLALLGERYNRSTYEYEYEIDADEAVLLDAARPESESKSKSGPGSSEAGARSDGGNGDNNDSGHDGNRDINSDNGTSNGGSGSKAGRGEGGGGRKPRAARIKRTYLLDVNPHYGALTKGNGANIIDARWIDTSTGVFIDITGLRERDPERSPGIWSCKNNHRYRTGELWPLRRTEFEGVEAWIPYSFDKILTDEYGPKSLVNEEWAGYVIFIFLPFSFLLPNVLLFYLITVVAYLVSHLVSNSPFFATWLSYFVPPEEQKLN